MSNLMNRANLRFFALLLFILPSDLTAGDLPANPVDYSEVDDYCEYSTRGILRRGCWINKTGKTEALVYNPKGLDQRREAIIDALWEKDEEKFHQLAKSPITGKGGLANQKFCIITGEWNRHRDDNFRTMRSHPVDPVKDDGKDGLWCRHQWMSLPENLSSKPKRGNLNLIFDPEDLSLRFVRIVSFKNSSINYLPCPCESIPADPVVDRSAAKE